jgi:hypothetical protein
MARRTEHKLQGWRELGFVTTDWRIDPEQDQWFHMEHWLNLPEPQRLAMDALLESNPKLTRVRQLSPYEVWHQRKNELTPLQVFKLPDLLGMDAGIPNARSKRASFSLPTRTLTPSPLIFNAAFDSSPSPLGERAGVRWIPVPFREGSKPSSPTSTRSIPRS